MYTLPTLIGLVGLASAVANAGPDTTCTETSTVPPTVPYLSSSEPPTGPFVPSSTSASVSPSSTPDCWTQCFEQAGITSESELCGNTEVDQCIHDTCSKAEDNAYWAWYESFCPATSGSASSTPVTPVSPVTTTTSTTPVTSASQTPDCWSACFSKYDITSEAAVCGDDDVSQCIQSTCSSSSSQAYWTWYNSYCPAVTTLVTITSTIPCSTAPGSAITTTYVSETTIPGSPGYSSPASPVESTPGSPPAPYSSPASPAPYSSPASPAPYSSPVSPVGTAASSGWGSKPSASGYPVVPSTGEGAMNKPGALIAAGALALAALF